MARRAPSTPAATRAELVEEMHLAGRELSTAAVLFHTAVARRRGLSATEEKALDVLLRVGPLTHSQLVEHLVLAPASVTDLVDRLERKGYAERRPHPDDRRRVLVAANEPRVLAAMAPLFADFVRDLEELYGGYDDDELRLILDFMRKATERQQAAADRLTADGD